MRSRRLAVSIGIPRLALLAVCMSARVAHALPIASVRVQDPPPTDASNGGSAGPLSDTRRIGIAVKNAGDLSKERWQRVAQALEEARIPVGYVQIGAWNAAGQKSAAELGLTHVLMIEDLDTKRTKPRSKRFSSSDRSHKLKLDFQGASGELEAELLRFDGTWKVIGGWSDSLDRDLPDVLYAKPNESHRREVVQPEDIAVRLCAFSLLRSAVYSAEARLWEARVHLSGDIARMTSPETANFWHRVAPMLPGAWGPLPRASLIDCASESWRVLCARAPKDPPADDESCEWCKRALEGRPTCACDDARALGETIYAVNRLLQPAGKRLEPNAKGESGLSPLQGHRPSLAQALQKSNAEKLAAVIQPDRDALAKMFADRSRDEDIEATAHALVNGFSMPDEMYVVLVDPESAAIDWSELDADLLRVARTICVRVDGGLKSELRGSGVNGAPLDWNPAPRLPFVALAQQMADGKPLKVIDSVRGDKLTIAAFASFVERAMWLNYGRPAASK